MTAIASGDSLCIALQTCSMHIDAVLKFRIYLRMMTGLHQSIDRAAEQEKEH